MLRSVASSALRTQRLMLRRPVASGAMCSLRHSSSIVPILGIEGVAESESKSALVTQQATPDEMFEWCTGSVGLREEVAAEYVMKMINEGFDSPASVALASAEDLARLHIRTGHARVMMARAADLSPAAATPAGNGLPPPRLFDYPTITANVSVADAIEAIEDCFAQLAKGKVDVPFPMHIGPMSADGTEDGDCHIKGGYIANAQTWTVKLACVSFYKNLAKGFPPGGGIFVVMNAVTGAPLAIMQENRFLTDLRTGAAGACAVKHLSAPNHNKIGFIGAGAIAKVMARATACVRPGYSGYVYAQAGAEEFAADMKEELGLDFTVVASAQELCGRSDVVFTQTPGGATVLEKKWLRPHATVIASGSDQPTKQELPVDLLKDSKYVCDLVGQVARVGELRSAIKAGVMTEADVHAELGQIINGDKPGREGNELIVCDLTGTGAQDAAIGQVAWNKLSAL